MRRRDSTAEVIVFVNDETKWNLKQKAKICTKDLNNDTSNNNRKRLIVDLIKHRSTLNKNYSKL